MAANKGVDSWYGSDRDISWFSEASKGSEELAEEYYKAMLAANNKLEAWKANADARAAKAWVDSRIEAQEAIQKADESYEKRAIDAIAAYEKRAKKKLNEAEYAERLKLNKKLYAEIDKLEEKSRRIRENTANANGTISSFFNGNWKDAAVAFKKLQADEGTGKALGGVAVAALNQSINALSDFTKKLDSTITTIAGYKSGWDTRLMGASTDYSGLIGSSRSLGGATSIFKQADLNNNINKAVELGIAYNIEQRAFLETISDKIATTFDAFDSSLLEIIRVQQSDSTAARLGMEANLTTYLNSMFSDTSYLNSTRGSVTSALYNALSLMNTGNLGIDVEYQAQKWLGSLYSVGMSNNSVNSIATALGQLLSGDVSGLNQGSGVLLNMAASKSGISIADMLVNGLDGSELNTLMQTMVEYLETIANDNHVVQTQYAKVFGLSTADIQAAKNLNGSISNIAGYGSGYGYSAGIGNLLNMAGSIKSRMTTGERMTNLWDNVQYSIASGIAENPIMYALYEAASMLDNTVGGIKIPDFSVMGTGVSLNTSVADLTRVAVLGGSLISSMGDMVNSLSMGGDGAKMLSQLGITGKATSLVRGTGLSMGSVTTGGGSETSYQGNKNDSTEYYNTQAKDQRQEVLQENESDAKDMDDVYERVDLIYQLLESVTDGSSVFYVAEKGTGAVNPLWGN